MPHCSGRKYREEASMKNTIEDLKKSTGDMIDSSISSGTQAVQEAIRVKLDSMMNKVAAKAEVSLERFAGVNEEEILTFMPDRRSFAGIGPILLGLLLVIILPGFWKAASLLFFLSGGFLFLLAYVNNAKIDIPDGYEGVICKFGSPQEEQKARKGRNWLLNYAVFIPFLVSKRDQVVDTTNANFTGDFGSISLSKQIVFRVVDAAKFIANTSPAAIMKILNLYASYIALRMITSMDDARVKFTGRDRLDNVVSSLNQYLAEAYGIRVIRISMPTAENEILEELETVRTQLKQIDAMKETKQVRLESAIKEVESQMRTKRKETRSKSLGLQQARITLETNVAEKVNTKRQEVLIKARRRLEENLSSLRKEISSFKARLEKAKTIRQVIQGLEVDLDLKKASLKRRVFQLMMPQRIAVFGVEGVGPGIGMGIGNELFKSMINRSGQPPTADSIAGEHSGGAAATESSEKADD
jgi:hypothetical protein